MMNRKLGYLLLNTIVFVIEWVLLLLIMYMMITKNYEPDVASRWLIKNCIFGGILFGLVIFFISKNVSNKISLVWNVLLLFALLCINYVLMNAIAEIGFRITNDLSWRTESLWLMYPYMMVNLSIIITFVLNIIRMIKSFLKAKRDSSAEAIL